MNAVVPADPTPPIQIGRVDTFDPDQHADTVAPWNVRFDQLSSGNFRGRTDAVRTARVTVYKERWNRKVVAQGQSPAGYAAMGTTASRSIQIGWCGDLVSAHRLAYAERSTDVDFSTADNGAAHVMVLVRSDLLEEFLGDRESRVTQPERYLRCDPLLGDELLATAASIISRYTSQPSLGNDRFEQATLESEVLGIVAACAGWGPSPGDDPMRRRDATRRAIAYVKDRRAPITIPQLARELEVSERTLLYAFREELDITPQRFVKYHRLNGARRDLLSAEPDTTTVTTVATSWGFCELGRFAVDYRALFGVSPSQTLSRIKPRPGLR